MSVGSLSARVRASVPPAIVGLGLLSSGWAAEAQPSPDPDRYIVKFRDERLGRGAVRGAGGDLLLDLPWLSAAAARIPAVAVQGLRNNPNIEYLETDPPRYPLSQATPYGIKMVQADQVSDGGASAVKVCIIDSGYDVGHEDLPFGANVGGTDDSGAGPWDEDGSGHGTHVAGTIVALNNALGVLGVLPNGVVNVHIVRVFGDDGAWAYSSTLIHATNQCQNNGADVISMSLGCNGSRCSSTTERNQFESLYSGGVLSFAAAGNAGNTQLSYPAAYDKVISIGAVGENKVLASFSQRNSDVELVAPGVAVLSTVPTGTGFDVSLVVGGDGYEASALAGSFEGTGSGTLVDCGLGTSACPGAEFNVCLIQRGSITFADKVLNCQSGGGVAAVIYNNVSGMLSGTLGTTSTTIPSVGVSQETGSVLLGRLGQPSAVSVDDGHYDFFSGTSMATPHAAGVAALVWSHNPSWTNVQIRTALQASAEDLGAAGRDNSYGFGLVRAQAALTHLGGGPPPSTSTPTSTPTSAPATATATPTAQATQTPTATPSSTGVASSPTPTPTATWTPVAAETSTPTPTATSTLIPSPTPTSGAGLTLSAVGYKVRGLQKADLSWNPGPDNVDVFRDGMRLYATANDGFHTDPINRRGGGTYSYRICLAGTATCSNTVNVAF